MDRILAGALPSPVTLARDLGPLAVEGRLLFWTTEPLEQDLLRTTHMLGESPRSRAATVWVWHSPTSVAARSTPISSGSDGGLHVRDLDRHHPDRRPHRTDEHRTRQRPARLRDRHTRGLPLGPAASASASTPPRSSSRARRSATSPRHCSSPAPRRASTSSCRLVTIDSQSTVTIDPRTGRSVDGRRPRVRAVGAAPGEPSRRRGERELTPFVRHRATFRGTVARTVIA